MKTEASYRGGFSLVEVLVVIAIIGILATVAVVALGGTRAKSRDSKRVGYIKQINEALELYYLHHGIYPTAITPGQNLASGNTIYLNPMPTNPIPRTDGGCPNKDFEYTPISANISYQLSFCIGGATGSYIAGEHVCIPGGTCHPN